MNQSNEQTNEVARLREEAEKAEAEAIQLKAQLNQALAIATQAHEEIGKFFRGIDYTRIGMEIYELKLTIK
jgi:ribosomal protein L9